MSQMSSTETLLSAHSVLSARVRAAQLNRYNLLKEQEYDIGFSLIPSPPPTPPDSRSPSPQPAPSEPPQRTDLPPPKRARLARYQNYVPEEETIRNDYSQHYVDSGEWPQNWVLGAEPERRFEEYPKQQRLLAMKKAAVEDASHPPLFVPMSSLSSLHSSKFDVILIDPPFSSTFTWNTLSDLPVPTLAADPSFVFLWVGSGAGDGLERGREILAKWGYRRCEDVVWVKTNKTTNRGPGCDAPTTSLFVRTKQHCLMGIRGTVRRSTDSWFVHCNIDTDVIIWEGDPADPTRKPPEMYTLVENFCLGTRRLELFGRLTSLRRGWVTAGDFEPSKELLQELGAQLWNKEQWEIDVKKSGNGKPLVPNSPEIELLRPKSPVRSNTNTSQSTHIQAQTPNVGNANPVMSGFPVPSMMPGMMPMGMQMPMAVNPGMPMMPIPMNMNMGMGMGMPNMGFGMDNPMMPMWMGMQGDPNFTGHPAMGHDMWMNENLRNTMGPWMQNPPDPGWMGG